MRIGDVSRLRRFADPARLRWYAHHRAVRFARRMGRLHHGLAKQPPCANLEPGEAIPSWIAPKETFPIELP